MRILILTPFIIRKIVGRPDSTVCRILVNMAVKRR